MLFQRRLIRLRGCAGWYKSSPSSHVKRTGVCVFCKTWWFQFLKEAYQKIRSRRINSFYLHSISANRITQKHRTQSILNIEFTKCTIQRFSGGARRADPSSNISSKKWYDPTHVTTVHIAYYPGSIAEAIVVRIHVVYVQYRTRQKLRPSSWHLEPPDGWACACEECQFYTIEWIN